VNFAKLKKKIELSVNFELLTKTGFVLVVKRIKKRISDHRPTPIYKLTMTSMVWNISIGQHGLDVRLCSVPAPAHLLTSWIWETEKKPLIS